MKRSHSFDNDDEEKKHYNYNRDQRTHTGDKVKQSKDEDRAEIRHNGKSSSSGANGLHDKTNRIEQMEYENYSLRKRCKRLEGIVTQLLETKGKNENSSEINKPKKDDLKLHCNDHALHIKQPHEYERRSVSPRYRDQSPRIMSTPVNKPLPISAYSDSYPEPSNIKVVSSSDAAIRAGEAYIHQGSVTQVHVPAFKRKEYLEEPSRNPLISQTASPYNINTLNIKLERKSVSPTGEAIDKDKQNTKDVSPEEMEQRNEMFRSTYYVHREKSRNCSHDDKVLGKIQCDNSRTKKHSPLYLSPGFTEKERYSERAPSPNLLSSSYFGRQYSYDCVKLKREHADSTENYRPDSLRIASHRDIREDSRNFYKLSAEEIHNSRMSPPMKARHIQQTTDLHCRGQIQPYIPSLSRPRPQVSLGHEFSKYNSDFYTKLPPKLHIVENQNENGVTITWNTTSNCDSSLVKSYQLFARELFGHKVGTMKRIGIIDALPLPMSCNIDKLKYHIKYKFAVCAVDIYGRFGKMSNFTGKFELKPKGPIQHEDNNKELQVEIIL